MGGPSRELRGMAGAAGGRKRTLDQPDKFGRGACQ